MKLGNLLWINHQFATRASHKHYSTAFTSSVIVLHPSFEQAKQSSLNHDAPSAVPFLLHCGASWGLSNVEHFTVFLQHWFPLWRPFTDTILIQSFSDSGLKNDEQHLFKQRSRSQTVGGSLLLLRRGGEKMSKQDGNSITEGTKAFEDTQNRGGVHFF